MIVMDDDTLNDALNHIKLRRLPKVRLIIQLSHTHKSSASMTTKIPSSLESRRGYRYFNE